MAETEETKNCHKCGADYGGKLMKQCRNCFNWFCKYHITELVQPDTKITVDICSECQKGGFSP